MPISTSLDTISNMIELINNTSLQINEDLLLNITVALTKKDIELMVVDIDEMHTLNKEQRNIDSATDVLSFPYEEMPMAPLGSIVICKTYVEEKAKDFSHSQENEFTLLFIHGLLHLLGYDHEVDDGQMRMKEKELIEEFNLPKSLIVRNQG